MTTTTATTTPETTALVISAGDALARIERIPNCTWDHIRELLGGKLDTVGGGVHDGGSWAIYLDRDRAAKELPANPAATALARAIGWRPPRVTDDPRLYGTIVIIGYGSAHASVPVSVMAQAVMAGLIGTAQ